MHAERLFQQHVLEAESRTGVQDAFPGEGEASDYVVSSLHATDCSRNLFGTASSTPTSRLSAPIGASRHVPCYTQNQQCSWGSLKEQFLSFLISMCRRLLSGNSQQQGSHKLRAAFGSNFDNFRRQQSLRKH